MARNILAFYGSSIVKEGEEGEIVEGVAPWHKGIMSIDFGF